MSLIVIAFNSTLVPSIGRTTDGTDNRDEKKRGFYYPCYPCHPWFSGALDFPDLDVLEIDFAAVVLQADVALERLVLDLFDLRLIDVQHFLVVERDLDARPDALDVDDVPLRRGLAALTFGAT